MYSYRFLIFIFSPIIFGHLFWKSIRLKQPRFLLQRLGLQLKTIPKNCLWFHCASVGETNTILPLLHELRKRHPKIQCLITSNTITAAKIVERQNLAWLFHVYLPMDWSNTTNRFLRKTKPQALYLVETELWPNLISLCKKNDIAVNIINGRLSNKTTAVNSWVRSVYKQTLSLINHIYVRSEIDQKAYLKLGAAEQQISVLGNLKFTPPAISDITSQNKTQSDYVILASSHDDEEFQITKIWCAMNRQELLLIAPRHPERCDGIINQLKKIKTLNSNNIARYSNNDQITVQTKVYILDTVGELVHWFADAKLVIMAGSFKHRGGHNILEPAHFGKAIIFGPHMESFVDESELLISKAAALQVYSFDELADSLALLLDNKASRIELEQNIKHTLQPFANIVTDYANIIDPQL